MKKLTIASLAALTLAIGAAGSATASSDDRYEHINDKYHSEKYCNQNSERCEYAYRHDRDDRDERHGYRHDDDDSHYRGKYNRRHHE